MMGFSMEDERRRVRRSVLGPGSGAVSGGGGPDLIGALPDDLLLQVLVRLRCARTAARTSLLSRRWRGLWTQLPDLIFRNVTLVKLLPALAAVQAEPGGVSLLDIRVARHYGLEAPDVPSLLRAAAGLSPVEFTLSLPRTLDLVDVELPRFHRATSIQLYAENLRITLPPWRSGGFFYALERLSLSLSGCCLELAALVLRCPRLRVLCVTEVRLAGGIHIWSESLQELYVRTDSRSTDYVNVEAPALKKLTMVFCAGAAELSVSVVAPVLDKVSWECSADSMSNTTAGLGPWGLSKVSLHAATESHRVMTGAGAGEDTCFYLCNDNVLSLQMTAHGLSDDAELNFVKQIEKHLVTDFSVLTLKMGLGSTGHVFGPLVLHLLGSHPIRTATRRLHILFKRSKVKEECPENCPCDEPKNWRSKNIALINLEEVIIDGFEWEDHEFDFLKVIFRCAPMLKRMVVGTLYKITASDDWCTKLHDIFKAYPSVECNFVAR